MAMNCPECKRPLQNIGNGPNLFFVCVECGGRSINLPMLEKNVSTLIFKRILSRLRDTRKLADRACPSCQKDMRSIPVELYQRDFNIEVCNRCQLAWFDYKEFEELPLKDGDHPELVIPSEIQEQLSQIEVADGQVVSNYLSFRFDASDFGIGWDEKGKKWATWQIVPGLLGIPVERESILTRKPWLTWSLLLLVTLTSVLGYFCAITSVRENTLPFCPVDPFRELGLIPMFWDRWGGLTFLTYFFLHGDLPHLLGNMYYFWTFGDNVEDQLGHGRYLLLLALGSAGGGLLHAVLGTTSDVPLIGASAGVSTLGMFYMLRYPRGKMAFFLLFRWIRLPAYVFMIIWVVLQFSLARLQVEGSTNVSGLAHVGGALVGALGYFVWKKRWLEEVF